ncbi:hypothetical protein LTR37_006870 [Vermiconidia calcicola]|uniref:Uncharacterized protein n=1 Tax=Vermiconidia calcicola TaxID=1690605 RepID=A0ACC3NF94_9PEZI|nr:hypothetical protein LTR37_006870 [Vermiconidia calcicola]
MEALLARNVDFAETTDAEGSRSEVKEMDFRCPDCGPSNTAPELARHELLATPGPTLTLSNSGEGSRDEQSIDPGSSASGTPVTQAEATGNPNEGSILCWTGRRISDFATNLLRRRTPGTTTRTDAEASEPARPDRGEPSTLDDDDSFELVDGESDEGEDSIVEQA